MNKPLFIDRIPEETRVVFQGVEGSYSSDVCNAVFHPTEKLCVKTFEEVLEDVIEEKADFGILPVENSSTGSLREVYDLLMQYKVYVVAEKAIKIEHHLFGVEGAELQDIREIYSHPQAFLQCEQFIESLDSVKLTPHFNTAISAKEIARLGDKRIGVIASRYAGELYGLKTLVENIHYNPNNYTKFFILAKQLMICENASKISVVFSVSHQSGALYKVLSTFAENDLNLIKLESRPYPNSKFKYYFLADFEGNLVSSALSETIEKISMQTDDFLFLGNYPVL